MKMHQIFFKISIIIAFFKISAQAALIGHFQMPNYKKSREVNSEVESKFTTTIAQNRFTHKGELEHNNQLKKRILNYLKSDLIGGTFIVKNSEKNRVVINNEVYSVGNCLEFPNEFGILCSPIPDVNIYIKSIYKDKIEFYYIKRPFISISTTSLDVLDETIEVCLP